MHEAGAGSRAIARETGISEPSWRRHVKKCGKGKVAPSGPTPVLPSALALPAAEVPVGHPVAPLLAQLAEIHASALEAYVAAVDRKDVNQQILLLPQLRNNIRAQEAMLAKIEPPKDETERLLGNPDFHETALCIAAALDVPPTGSDDWRAGWAAARLAFISELEQQCGGPLQ